MLTIYRHWIVITIKTISFAIPFVLYKCNYLKIKKVVKLYFTFLKFRTLRKI